MASQDLSDVDKNKTEWYRSELLWVAAALFVYFAVIVLVQINKTGSPVSLLVGDPSCYYYAMMAWKKGTLGPGIYLHGIGMGALGYFTSIAQNPFLLWSFVFFVFTNLCVWRLLRRIVDLKWAIAAHSIIALTFVSTNVYVSSTNNMTTYALIVYTVLTGLESKTLGFRKGALLGALYGVCFACRYADPILLLPLVVYVLLRGFRDERRTCVLGWIGFAAFALPWLFFTLYMHHTYLGSITTTPYATKIPYVERIHGGTEGLANHMNVHFFNDTLRNAYQVFVNPKPYARPIDYSGPKALLWGMPYLVLALPGLWFWWRSRTRDRGLVYVLLASFGIYFVFYCSHWAFTAHDLQYGCLRYMAGWYYVAAVGAVLAVKHVVLHFHEKRPPRELTVPVGLLAGLLVLLALFPVFDQWYLSSRMYKDKSGWTVLSNTRNPNTAAIIDGNLETYWVTPEAMIPGQTLIIDFGDVRSISQVRFNHADNAETSFPKQIEVFASQSADGDLYPFTHVRSGRQNHIWILYFDSLRCRRLAFRVKKPSNDQWLIHECEVLR